MKILLTSHRFAPSVGGVETVGRMLAEEFSEAGHQVRVVTDTVSAEENTALFRVLRRPGPLSLWTNVRWSDVCFHNNISLRLGWPLAWIDRPWLVTHHTWIRRPDQRISWPDRLKRHLLRHATSIAISRAIADELPLSAQIIPDPYDDSTFYRRNTVVRNGDFIFVGRLVSDKGMDLALEALALLRRRQLTPRLTVVGDGVERSRLTSQCAALGLTDQVTFVGEKTGTSLAELLNAHRVLVVPSRWNEPFGLVALEAIACGCAVVGSQGGGLPEAIGPCGVTFPNGDAAALAEALAKVREGAAAMFSPAQAEEHLAPHRREVVARAYLRLFEATCRATRSVRPRMPRIPARSSL